ncbi:MAG: hypothetical protein KDD47_19380 [Acidobacteria bacterium]|nr:hypothetical protein [Acidobacteriota bacterium]
MLLWRSPCLKSECLTRRGRARTYISCGKLFADLIQGNAGHSKERPSFGLTPDAGAFAAGINGCWQCHGSEVKILDDGRPDPKTWPNAGVGRKNPDGSKGNCSSCHQRHVFALAEARRPELCGVCHNDYGGEPQREIYGASRHGVLFEQNVDKMNLDSPRWVAGEDYSVAPTCATCHISAAADMPVTHDVDLRILNRGVSEDVFTKLEIARLLTCRCGPDFCTPCKVEGQGWSKDYECRINTYPGEGPAEQTMAGVCKSCHSETLTQNFFDQYYEAVDLVMSKWIDPGRELYRRATEVLEAVQGDQYAKDIGALGDSWGTICNHGAKYPIYGASMMSPGFTESSLAAVASAWYDDFLPALAGIIGANICSENAEVRGLTEALEKELCEVLSNPTYGAAWRSGQRGKPELDPEFCYDFIEKNPCSK